jgi:hypothetical protein
MAVKPQPAKPGASAEGDAPVHRQARDEASNPIGPYAEAIPGKSPGIVEEQMARSAEIQAMGVEAWKEAHDERPPEQRTNRQIPGVGPTTVSSSIAPPPESGSWAGSSRSTPEARDYGNRGQP